MPNDKHNLIELKADSVVIFDIMDDLRRTFEETVNNYDKPIEHIDGLMAAHNFHKLIVTNVCQGESKSAQLAILTMAKATFSQAMDELIKKIE